jgi:TonB family protein
MELSENDIVSIDQYLNGELKGEELSVFEERLANDASFADAVEMHTDTTTALREAGKQQMKADLTALQQSIPMAEFAAYDPPKGGGGSGSSSAGFFKSWAFWIGLMAITPVITISIYHYTVTIHEKKEIRTIENHADRDCFEVPVKLTAGPSIQEKAGKIVPYYGELPSEEENKDRHLEIDDLISAPSDSAVSTDTLATIDVAEAAPETAASNLLSVCVIHSDSNYRFHYQFEEGKLLLYGPFDHSVAILQLQGEEESGFYILEHQGSFYDVAAQQAEMVPLCKIEFEKVDVEDGTTSTNFQVDEPIYMIRKEGLGKEQKIDTILIQGWIDTSTASSKTVVSAIVPVELSGNNNEVSRNSESSQVMEIADIMPSFKGGTSNQYKWISENLRYPKKAIEMGLEGKVYTQFIVRKDGSISDVKTLVGIGGGCDAEARRVIREMPKWAPAKHKGVPVDVRFVLPLTFSLRGSGN